MVSFIFLKKKTSWQSSLRRLLQKVFQFVLVPGGAFLIDFGSFETRCRDARDEDDQIISHDLTDSRFKAP